MISLLIVDYMIDERRSIPINELLISYRATKERNMNMHISRGSKNITFDKHNVKKKWTNKEEQQENVTNAFTTMNEILVF